MMRIFTILGILLCSQVFNAQQPSSHKKKNYTDENGNLYWNKDKPVYLRISDTPDGAGQLLKSKKSVKYTNPMYLDTEGLNYIRSRYAVDPTTKESITPFEEVLWEIYADGTAPRSTFNFSNAKKHVAQEQTFFGPGLKATIATEDALSGVANTFFTAEGKNFSTYTGEFSFDQNGEYHYQYYSVDKVGNVEKIRSEKFIVDVVPPTSFYNIVEISEDKTIGPSSKIYITSEDNLSGVHKTFYRFDEQDFQVLLSKEVDFNHLEDGKHTLYCYSEDWVGNREQAQQFEFYFDKSAPIVAANILGDRFVVDDVIYFSGRTKLKLTTVDNRSGVKEVRYAVNDDDFKSYKEPFYLPGVSGIHKIKYYGLDNFGNNLGGPNADKYEHNVQKIYLDLNGPSLGHEYIGKSFKTKDALFIGPTTRIKLNAVDEGSGTKQVTYSQNGALEEVTYEAPFTVETSGPHKLEIFGYDNVNNRNIESFKFVVDRNPPIIITNFSTAPIARDEGVNVYPEHGILYLAATDRETGADKIHYKLNNGPKRPYKGSIQGFKKGEKYEIEVLATDKLENQSSKVIRFKIG